MPGASPPAAGRRSPPAAASPLDPGTLHERSAREVYALLCKHHRCKPNSGFAATLPSTPGDFRIERIDVSLNIVGRKGVAPLMDFARLSPVLTHIDLRDNCLDNAAVQYISASLRDHCSVQSVDLSRNPIGWVGGMAILDMVNSNPTVMFVGMDDTFLESNIIRTIERRTALNTDLSGDIIVREKRRRQMEMERAQALQAMATARPISHINALRMLKLRQKFDELVDREGLDGRVPKRCIVEGYKESMIFQSRETELEGLGGRFYEGLKARCCADAGGRIGWDAFFVVLMVDGATYSADEVAAIRSAHAAADPEGRGFVRLSALREIAAGLNGGVEPSDEYLAERMGVFGADEGHTVAPDELVVMLVSGAPAASPPAGADDEMSMSFSVMPKTTPGA